ncbi:uncharacterized protein TNIN_13111 [Trichonephila inaurata madagascariensis]|uniref:Integrase catalytic domain-containing protein n=1 Tax=Trichonephila inaurata madagascariensis TaxID=2747483 RepID=A0A8X6Y6E6_9ARAC|nr:uncharacterized protein TNIN_13111 [Trichonephila inaurata madagascariensis]
MGIASGNYGHLLIPIMLKQLPHDLVVEFHRQKDSKNIGDVRESMKFIKFEIESRELANIALGHSQGIPENSRYPPRNLSYQRQQFKFKHNFPSSSALTTVVKNVCIFYNSDTHTSIGCQIFSNEEKRNKLKKEGRCYRCMTYKNIEYFTMKVKKHAAAVYSIFCTGIGNDLRGKDASLLGDEASVKTGVSLRDFGKEIKKEKGCGNGAVAIKEERNVEAGENEILVLKARQTIWSRQKRCITSRRLNSNPGNQVIYPLPDVRVTESPPFAVVGIDFTESFFFKDSDAEQYILLITCTVTRSVRLELVGIMTTDIFLLALRRFIARRGLCFNVILNNARMFKRSELVLQQMWKCYTMQIKTNYYIIKRPVQLLHNLEIQD